MHDRTQILHSDQKVHVIQGNIDSSLHYLFCINAAIELIITGPLFDKGFAAFLLITFESWILLGLSFATLFHKIFQKFRHWWDHWWHWTCIDGTEFWYYRVIFFIFLNIKIYIFTWLTTDRFYFDHCMTCVVVFFNYLM